MTTNLLEERLRELAVATPDPGRVLAYVLRARPQRRTARLPRVAAATVAVVVLAALIAYFVPAADTAVANVPVAGDLLREAGLAGARDRITWVGSRSTSSGYTITLDGAYADSTRTVLLIRSNPPSLPSISRPELTDQFGRSYDFHGGTTDMRTGDATMEFDALAWPDALTGARITLHISSVEAVGNDYRPGATVQGSWNLPATIGIDEATSLPPPPVASTGSIQYRFTAVSYTPATISIDMLVTGTTAEQLNSRIPDGGKGTPVFTIDLLDPNGEVINGTWTIGQDRQGVRIHFLAYRVGASGDHVLRVGYVGQGNFERVLRIP